MKAQTAIEFLMTYGWAILVIIVVGIALASLGFFSPGLWMGSKRITGFSDIGVEDFVYYDSNKSLEVILVNRYTTNVNITNAWIVHDGNTYEINTTNPGSCRGGVLTSGQKLRCNFIFTNLSVTGSISANLIIEFTPLAGLQTPLNSSGTIYGPVS
ncbi:MAG: hypothetical protein QW507_02625 [Candidatus Nanoarchaeia archaeon]|nr:hypothetical protein [Candidatus Haiyanarchaeum thermophilum]MCW1303343.1 hypothetical protein [Candidatus Haiyanarchaeum thermophilum]MCW1304075.1 hypothetical protein [Candidatus Haiyanarchaeum thermophilum]MCW1306503.1 hypothetical protein [Candidatus Haiyanarchaeum thermophilum]MCW1307545.1 hypothetical protein [Candidatus Haiyanarchaeum thermophilum]